MNSPYGICAYGYAIYEFPLRGHCPGSPLDFRLYIWLETSGFSHGVLIEG